MILQKKSKLYIFLVLDMETIWQYIYSSWFMKDISFIALILKCFSLKFSTIDKHTPNHVYHVRRDFEHSKIKLHFNNWK